MCTYTYKQNACTIYVHVYRCIYIYIYKYTSNTKNFGIDMRLGELSCHKSEPVPVLAFILRRLEDGCWCRVMLS